MKAAAVDTFKVAKALAKSGQPVFPCRPIYQSEKFKAKAPLVNKGLKAATTDKKQIKAWWSQFPGAAVGITTGVLYDVLDVDIKHGVDGRGHLVYLNRLGLLNGCQKVIETPSGGWHLYFRAAPGLTNKANSKLGLDVRAAGGYVLAAGSYIDARKDPDARYDGYYVDHGAPEGSTDEPLYWDLILSALMPTDASTDNPVPLLPSERRASVAALREWVSIREKGERNNALHWAVCRCIDNNIDPHELVDAAVLSGLSEDEVLFTINAALRRAGLRAEQMDSESEALFPDE